MKEYKVEKTFIMKMEKILNERAKEGWILKGVCPNNEIAFGIILVLERDTK